MRKPFVRLLQSLLLRPWPGVLMLISATMLLGIHYGTVFRFPDESDYFALAQSLLEGNGFREPGGALTAYRPPGYPFFLWLTSITGHGILLAKLLHALLLGATALIGARIVRTLGGRFSGLPPLMFLAYPVLLFTATTLYPQTMGAFLLVILLWLTFFGPNLLKSVLAGLMLGFLILCIPAFLLTAPVLACLLLTQRDQPVRDRFLRVSILTLSTLLVVAPWTYRNYRVFNAFVPVSTNSGLNLFLGNSPGTTPGSGITVDRSHLEEDPSLLPEMEQDQRYRELAINWIREDPGSAFRLYLGKVLHNFHFTNRLATASENTPARDLLMLVTWVPLLLLFCARPFFRRRFPLSSFERAVYWLVLSNALLSAVFFTRIRLRLPFDVLMILSNAVFLNRVLQSLSEKTTFPSLESHER